MRTIFRNFMSIIFASLIGVGVAACQTTSDPRDAGATQITDNEEIVRILESARATGTWSAKGSSGDIEVTFSGTSTPASYYVLDDGNAYTWKSDIEVTDNGNVVLTSRTVDRVGTYTMWRNQDGSLRLVGSYTYKGSSHGNVDLMFNS